MPFLSAEIMQGTFAGIPAFGSAGRIYFATDTGQTFYDSGSAWVDVSDAGVVTSVAGRAGAVTLAESDIASLTADLAAKATMTRHNIGHFRVRRKRWLPRYRCGTRPG
jgi:hypothetical protein